MNQPDPAAYPCPACHTPANLATGCPGCGRGPDAGAAGVIRLGTTIQRLAAEVERARQGYAEAVEQLQTAQRQRNDLAAWVRARTEAEQASESKGALLPGNVPQGAVPFTAPASTGSTPASTGAGAETSGRTVQNLLFVLGGLLLASAAIVFTAVAWANFGVVGRAAILATMTVLTLAVPPVALLRRLSGTAETFAALGLLLVLLDGYAAWYVNVAGVHALAPTRYAGISCAITAGVALVYGLVTRLTGPRLVALVATQPVAPLLVGNAGLGMAGWAAVFTALAAANLGVVWWIGRRAGTGLALRILVWALTGLAILVAAGLLLGALVSADAMAPAIRTGLALILAAAVVVAASLVGPVPALRHVAAGGAALAVVTAVARVTVVGRPAPAFALVAAEIAALAVVARVLPARVRPGPRFGILTAAGVLALGVTVRALSTGLMAVWSALPVWHGSVQPMAERSDWWLLSGIVLLGAAIAVLVPRPVAVEAAAGTAMLLALAAPGCVSLPWWTPSLVDGLVAVPLALAAVTARPVRRTAVYGGGAGLLATHAVLVGLARPASSTGVLAALVVVATGVAALGRAGSRLVGAVAAGTALLALPGLGAAIAATAGADPARVHGAAAAGLVLAVVALVGLRRRWPEYAWSGAVAVLLGAAGVAIAVVTGPGPYGVYSALAVLCDAVAVLAILPVLRQRAGAGPTVVVLLAVPVGPALAAIAPAVRTVLAGPYTWVDAVWSGRPAGAGLGVTEPGGPYAFGPAAMALGLLTLALLVVSRGWRPAALWWAVPATPAILAGAAALHAPWPTVAALSLTIGAGAALVGALRRPAPVLAVVAAVATGAGLAGALVTRATTLAALAVILVVAALCGLAGRRLGVRITGWLVAAVSAPALALAAALAADADVRWAALWVLGAAAVTLATSALLVRTSRAVETRRVEARLLEGAAHATALVALLLTTGALRHTAAVFTLWGMALGLSALRPGEPVVARRVRVAAAAFSELVAYWLLLVAGNVAVLEAYTLPAAGVALLAGWLAARTRPGLHSWSVYGPALLAGFAPSAAMLLVGAGEPARRLAIGVAAVIVVVAGSLRRRQAPVVVGGAVLALVAVHEVALVWDLLPRWIPLAVGGLLLVGLAITYERRRRDVARLREAVGRMR